MTAILTLLLALSTPFSWAGSEPSLQELTPHEKELYDQKKFDEFIQELKLSPRDSGYYHYNLGNGYFQTGDYGKALAHYEKANRSIPHDPDIQFNLKVSREILEKTLGEHRIDPSSSPLELLADQIPLNEVRGIIGLIFFFLAVFWIPTWVKTKNLRSVFLGKASLLGLSALALTLSLLGIQRFSLLSPPAVVIERAAIRSGPGETFLELSQMEPGTKLRTLGPTETPPSTQETWRQVRWSQEDVGWIKDQSLLLL